MKKYTKGFTLIELLVVIAIIGILASVVLVSLNSARNKGKAGRIQVEAAQLRTELESRYDGTTYPLENGSGGARDEIYTNAPWTNAADNLTKLRTDIKAQGGDIKIYSSGAKKDYAIYALFPTALTGGYCVDSTGGTQSYTTGSSFTATSNAVTCAAGL